MNINKLKLSFVRPSTKCAQRVVTDPDGDDVEPSSRLISLLTNITCKTYQQHLLVSEEHLLSSVSFPSRIFMARNIIVITMMLLALSTAFQNFCRYQNKRVFRNSFCSMASGEDPVLKNIISSTKSKSIKNIQNLLNKRKHRMGTGQTVVEGPRILFDLLSNPITQPLVRQIFVSVEDYEKEYKEKLSKDFDVLLVTSDVLKGALSDTVTPQGIVAIVDIPNFDIDPTLPNPIYLILDGVSDPGNVGTLVRSSLAVGCAGIILLPGCCDVWNPKAVRSAMVSTSP